MELTFKKQKSNLVKISLTVIIKDFQKRTLALVSAILFRSVFGQKATQVFIHTQL